MVDLSATSADHYCSLYFLPFHDPQAMGTDALLHSWGNLQVYAFSPWALIPQVLRKLGVLRSPDDIGGSLLASTSLVLGPSRSGGGSPDLPFTLSRSSQTGAFLSVTQPLYESRMNSVHDPAPPASHRPKLEFAGTPAPAIAKEFPGALSTQPKQKKSRIRRRRKNNRSANQNSARRSAAPVTLDDRWPNRNSASQRATRPNSTANDPQEMRSTSVYLSPSFHSSHLPQPPIPAANENSEHRFGLDHCEFSGLYKPAQIDPRQDLTATPTRVNSSGFGLSSPAPKQPCTKPFSGLPFFFFFFYEREHRTGKMCPFSSLHPPKKGKEVQ